MRADRTRRAGATCGTGLTREAGTTRGAGLTIVLLLSVACSTPADAPGQTSDDAGTAGAPQTFVQVPQGFAVSVFAN